MIMLMLMIMILIMIMMMIMVMLRIIIMLMIIIMIMIMLMLMLIREPALQMIYGVALLLKIIFSIYLMKNIKRVSLTIKNVHVVGSPSHVVATS